jgi:hypothetical protein
MGRDVEPQTFEEILVDVLYGEVRGVAHRREHREVITCRALRDECEVGVGSTASAVETSLSVIRRILLSDAFTRGGVHAFLGAVSQYCFMAFRA